MRCAVVIDGIIDNFIIADPSVDTLPDAIIVEVSDDIDYRYIWSGTELIPGPELQAEIDAIIADAWGE